MSCDKPELTLHESGEPIVSFIVHGQPKPYGSKVGFRTGKVCHNCRKRSGFISIVNQDDKKLKAWQTAVKMAAKKAWGEKIAIDYTALVVDITFHFKRPLAHFIGGKTGRLRTGAPRWKIDPPDTDKLIRATWDAMTGIIYRDDSILIPGYCPKLYASESSAHIKIYNAEDYQPANLRLNLKEECYA